MIEQGGIIIEVEIKLEKQCLTPKIVIYTDTITEEISELVKRLTHYPQHSLLGYRKDEIIMINKRRSIGFIRKGRK